MVKGGIEMSFQYLDHKHSRDKDRRHWKKKYRKGIDGAFDFRCCFATEQYELDFSNIENPCIPEDKKHRFHQGCCH